MTDAMIIHILKQALIEVLILSSPILFVSMIVGLIISIFQTTTSIQEQTLTFVPKIFAIFATLILLLTWIMGHIQEYTINLYKQMWMVIQ